MKIVWTLVALLLLGGLIVLFQPPATGIRGPIAGEGRPQPKPEPEPKPTSPPAATAERPRQATDRDAVAEAAAAAPTPATSAVTTPSTPAPTTASTEVAVATSPAPLPAATGPASAPSATPDPAPTPAPAVASGAEFRPEIPAIKEAELLPSRFVRLPDGGIAIDDAWTVRGEGTAEAPYEVSWEFLSSAQDDYAPRLGEKKLRERIAFLSGKRVRISGYLAFPLVAPTSSECLVMLNQWDGCCIGVPPTPYDAIEVKLAAELKGWKKHTINFGAVEGVLKVEPYLIENWLVGLYLLEGAKINTEL